MFICDFWINWVLSIDDDAMNSSKYMLNYGFWIGYLYLVEQDGRKIGWDFRSFVELRNCSNFWELWDCWNILKFLI